MPDSQVIKSENYVTIKLDTSEYLMDHAQYSELLQAILVNPPSDVVWMSVLTDEYAPAEKSARDEMVDELNDYVADTLMAYVDSFREHKDFHERCIETIFHHLCHNLTPTNLVVSGYFQRRGGIDITPHRSMHPTEPSLHRMGRQ